MSLTLNIEHEGKNLKQLVTEAIEKDSTFAFKFDYWVNKRRKTPDLNWLMPLLEDALGRSYVREQAKRYVESQEEATKDQSGSGQTG